MEVPFLPLSSSLQTLLAQTLVHASPRLRTHWPKLGDATYLDKAIISPLPPPPLVFIFNSLPSKVPFSSLVLY